MKRLKLFLLLLLALPIGVLAAGKTWQTATLVQDGETVSGSMDKNDPDHWYKIEVPKDGAVTLDVKTDGTLVMRYVELHAKVNDSDLPSWGYQYLYDVEKPFTVSGLKPGTYYVHLNRNDKAGTYYFKYTFTPNSYQNDTEPNDKWENAVLLNEGSTLQGHLGYDYWNSRDDDDWYKIVVPADGAVTLDVKTDENLVIRYVQLYAKSSDTDLASWGYQYLYDVEEPFTVSGVAPGTYYVHLNRNERHGGYSIKYTFTPNSYQNDTEPNNKWQEATKTLTSGSTVQGHLGYDYWNTRDDDDWYKITVPADGAVTFDVKTDDKLVIRYVQLYAKSDTDLASWGYQYLYDEEKPFTVSGVAPGTYYVHLNRNEKHGGYSLKYTFTPNSYQNDAEPNDKWQEATKTLTSGSTVEGHLGYDYWNSRDDDDWYKIVVPADGAVTFDVKSDDKLIIRYVELYAKSSGTDIASWGYQYLYDEEKPFTVSGVAPGTYYVRLNRNDKHGGYSLKYTFTRNRYPNDTEPNDEWKQAVTLEKDKTVSGHLGYNYWNSTDNDDWYKINLTQAGKIEVRCSTDPATSLVVRYIELYKLKGDDIQSLGYEYQYDQFRPIVKENLDAGTYYVKVNRNEGHGTYFLVWGATLGTVDPIPDDAPSGTEGKPGSNWNNAGGIELNGTTDHHMNQDNKTHWYRYTVKEDGQADITISLRNGLDINGMTLYVLDGQDLVGRASVDPYTNETATLTQKNLAPGTYYVSIVHFSGDGDYTITTRFTPCSLANDNEKNDTWQSASSINVGQSVTGHMGYFYRDSSEDSYDWYKIVVPSDGAIKLTLQPQEELDFYAISLNYINGLDVERQGATADEGGPGLKVTLSQDNVAAGTYYLCIPYWSGQGGYTLTYQHTPTPYANDIEPNDTWQTAQALNKGETLSGHLGYVQYNVTDSHDWYYIKVGQTSDIELTIQLCDELDLHGIKLYRLNDNLDYIGAADPYYGETKTLTVKDLAAGTYYLDVDYCAGHGYYFLAFDSKIGTPDNPDPGPGPGPGPGPDGDSNTCLVVWMSETEKHYYNLTEKPKITMNNGDFTVTTTVTTVTYPFDKVWKFTLDENNSTAIKGLKTNAEPSVERLSDRVVFTGCTPKSAIRIYNMSGRLVDTQWIDDSGRAEVSISGLAAGVYVVKSDSITLKIAKR